MYNPHLPAEATASFVYQPYKVTMTVTGRWDGRLGRFANYPRFAIGDQDVSWLLLNVKYYQVLESQALAALNTTRPTQDEQDRLVFDYMELMNVGLATAKAVMYAEHDRYVRNITRPGDTYFGLARNTKTGHWEWQPETIGPELSDADRLSMWEGEKYDRMKDDNHL